MEPTNTQDEYIEYFQRAKQAGIDIETITGQLAQRWPADIYHITLALMRVE